MVGSTGLLVVSGIGVLLGKKLGCSLGLEPKS